MTDILIGHSKGIELVIRDADDDGSYDEGERVGVRGPGDRFEPVRVREALGRVGIEGFRPGARLQRIGAYMDFVREAERWTNEGEFAMAAEQLRQAETFADVNGIVLDHRRFIELRWRILDGVRDAVAPRPGADTSAATRDGSGLDRTVLKDMETLRRDDDPGASSYSAGMILDLLTARSSIVNIENSAGPSRDRMLAEARAREASLREGITSRAARIRTVLESGSRTTLADQTAPDGTVIRVGDHVRYRDPETGAPFDTPFLVTGFEIRAEYVIVHGADLPSSGGGRSDRSGAVGYLEVLPREESAPRARPPSTEGVGDDEGDFSRLLARLGRGWDRMVSFLV